MHAEEGVLTGGLFPPGQENFADAKVSIGLPSANFCAALFDMYIGPRHHHWAGRAAGVWGPPRWRCSKREQVRWATGVYA